VLWLGAKLFQPNTLAKQGWIAKRYNPAYATIITLDDMIAKMVVYDRLYSKAGISIC